MVSNDSNFKVDYDEKNNSRDKRYLQNTANNTIYSTVCIISQVFYNLMHHLWEISDIRPRAAWDASFPLQKSPVTFCSVVFE